MQSAKPLFSVFFVTLWVIFCLSYAGQIANAQESGAEAHALQALARIANHCGFIFVTLTVMPSGMIRELLPLRVFASSRDF